MPKHLFRSIQNQSGEKKTISKCVIGIHSNFSIATEPYSAGTQPSDNVVITSIRRHDVASTLSRRLVPAEKVNLKPHSHCAGVATVHPDAGQPVYRDAPGHIS